MENRESNKHSVTLKEYGKNIQRLAIHISEMEDREKRTQSAFALVELVKQLNPQMKAESDQKIWDDIHIMSGFILDVDGPYPKPAADLLFRKPQRVGYPKGEVKFKHYGRNIEKLIEKAVELEDDEEQEAAIIYIGQLMRSFHSTWNRDNFDDAIILGRYQNTLQRKTPYRSGKSKGDGAYSKPIPEETSNYPSDSEFFLFRSFGGSKVQQQRKNEGMAVTPKNVDKCLHSE
jgi:hypothetical protein